MVVCSRHTAVLTTAISLQIISRRLSAEEIGNMNSNAEYDKFCEGQNKYLIRNDLSLMVTGQFLILAGQV